MFRGNLPLVQGETETVEVFHDFPGRFVNQQASVIQNHTIVNQQFHVLDDVGGQEYRFIPSGGKISQVFHEQTAIAGVQSHGEIVEDQQFRVLGK